MEYIISWVGRGPVLIYRAVQLIKMVCPQERKDERANKVVRRGIRSCGTTRGMDGIGYLWVGRVREHLMPMGPKLYCISQFCILPSISECEGSSVIVDYACNY